MNPAKFCQVELDRTKVGRDKMLSHFMKLDQFSVDLIRTKNNVIKFNVSRNFSKKRAVILQFIFTRFGHIQIRNPLQESFQKSTHHQSRSVNSATYLNPYLKFRIHISVSAQWDVALLRDIAKSLRYSTRLPFQINGFFLHVYTL